MHLDPSDGISWSILGNAHLMHFFSVSQNPRTLKQAMSAYKQAVWVHIIFVGKRRVIRIESLSRRKT